jgi:thiol-disulfide isomerase/thioredoxin
MVADGAGGFVVFGADGSQRFRTVPGWSVVSVAATSTDIWLADAEGRVGRLGAEGKIAESHGGLEFPALAADPGRSSVWLARRPDRWSYRLPDSLSPLLVVLPDGDTPRPIGKTVVPNEQLLFDFANAGHVAVRGDTVYFAPFLRDEIIALDAAGNTVWVGHRDLGPGKSEPRFVLDSGAVILDYEPINLGIAIGPPDVVYVLSTAGSTTAARLDAFDAANGTLLATAPLPTALPTVATDNEGRLYLLDAVRLLKANPPYARPAFPAFDLPLLGGGNFVSDTLRGRVVLVNFWASWCGPCRAELPGLATVASSYPASDFAFVTINEDVDSNAAARFVRELDLRFPVLMGGGKQRARYGYPGLPMTVLLDRNGLVVQRWPGYSGPEQLGAIRSLIDAELLAASTTSHGTHSAHSSVRR